MLDGILTGLSAAFTFQAIGLVVLGCLIGSFIGMVPGLGPMQVIAIMIPVAVGIGGPSVAMIALMIVYSTYLRAGGFIPSTFFLLLFGSIILGERRWVAMVLVSIIAPLAIWLLVTYVLDRTIPPLPRALMDMMGG